MSESEDGEKKPDIKHPQIKYDKYSDGAPLDEHTQKYIKKLTAERDTIDEDQYPLVYKLIQKELDTISKGGATPESLASVDLYNDAPLTLTVKAFPPAKLFPKFNYAGRIIGPRGTYLKALMKETMCKLVLLGKGVMKDKEKEEDLRSGSDPKFIHLNEDMHVLISVTAPSAEAFARISYAITCLKQHILSDSKTVEGLPWVMDASNSNYHGPGLGHGPGPSFDHHSPDERMMIKPRGPPPPRSYRPGPGPDYEIGEPYRRSFARDSPSDSPSSSHSRRPPVMVRPGPGMDPRAMNLLDKARMANSRYMPRETTPTPEAYELTYRSYYDHPVPIPIHDDYDKYEYDYDSGDYYQSASERGYKSTQKSRYAPYKK